MNTKFILFFTLLLALFIIQPSTSLAQDFPDVCLESDNILPNCNFDGGLNGWQTFTEDGSASFSVLQGGGECHAPLCPAAYIVTESHFVGGLYQQVPVVAGNTYYANIVWLAFDSLVNDASINNAVGGGVGRKIGIDPTGGTDPRSANIVWGPDNWRNDCKICDNQAVAATAQADTITVFVRIEDTWRVRAAQKGYGVPPSDDQFWLDDIGMKQVSGDAVAQTAPTEPPPTDTPVSPSNTPEAEITNTPLPATDTPVPPTEETSEENTGTETPETQPVSPVNTPTQKIVVAPPTLTPTFTRTPTNTPTPKPSPQPTQTRSPIATPTSSIVSTEILGIAGTTICAGILILIIMGAVIAAMIWLYRLGWGQVDTPASENDLEDDENITEKNN